MINDHMSCAGRGTSRLYFTRGTRAFARDGRTTMAKVRTRPGPRFMGRVAVGVASCPLNTWYTLVATGYSLRHAAPPNTQHRTNTAFLASD